MIEITIRMFATKTLLLLIIPLVCYGNHRGSYHQMGRPVDLYTIKWGRNTGGIKVSKEIEY